MKLQVSPDAQVLYLISSGVFIAWIIYSATHIEVDVSAVKAAVARYPGVVVSDWTRVTIHYGHFLWVVPLLALVAVVVSLVRGWSTRARAFVLGATGLSALALHIALTSGLYEPVEWFMHRVL